jgi:CheY-like chemotaxis protein
MIVDDDQLTALALMRALKADHMNILALARGSHALAEIRVNPYSLVFLEIGIADGTGNTVLREISRSSPSTCIVAMSAGMTNGVAQSTIIEHNHYFLPKPFEVLQVRTMTNRILSEVSRRNEDLVPNGGAGRKKRISVRRRMPGEVTAFPEPGNYYPGIPPQFVARMVDLSPEGIGVQTDLPLPPGQIFSLHGDKGSSRGIVRWSMVFENMFRAGIQFVKGELDV